MNTLRGSHAGHAIYIGVTSRGYSIEVDGVVLGYRTSGTAHDAFEQARTTIDVVFS